MKLPSVMNLCFALSAFDFFATYQFDTLISSTFTPDFAVNCRHHNLLKMLFLLILYNILFVLLSYLSPNFVDPEHNHF